MAIGRMEVPCDIPRHCPVEEIEAPDGLWGRYYELEDRISALKKEEWELEDLKAEVAKEILKYRSKKE